MPDGSFVVSKQAGPESRTQLVNNLKPSLTIVLWGGLGALWMAWLLHIRSLQGATLTDYVGLWSFKYLPQFRGLAPRANVVLFNAWMMVTSAGEWMILGWLLGHLKRRMSK